eukprot:TRINITY_DN170_c1_g1_i2.p1 TRINITY_DN170_c1_g1~~TRINITY_DN170_c1_g1_i2.p1  ORF type:complete len:623 (+),score=229.14 TRINITY_DN170_c1_g1_i2:87-1955(+)
MWIQRIARLTFVPGEPAIDRTRKELLVPMYCVLGTLQTIGLILTINVVLTMEGQTVKEQAAIVLSRLSTCLSAGPMLAVSAHVFRTRRLTKEMCEYSAVAIAVAIVMLDCSLELRRLPNPFSFINVVVLDCLLVCSCRDSVAKGVIAITVAWMLAETVLWAEDEAGDRGFERPSRFSMSYFVWTAVGFGLQAAVFLIDFHFTRGFATSMKEQKGLVEASIRVSEAAAVLLSRYETEATRALLGGAGGEQLPPLLRSSLLQLVDNLAEYRPYLPHTCLPGSDDGCTHSQPSHDPRDSEEPCVVLRVPDPTGRLSESGVSNEKRSDRSSSPELRLGGGQDRTSGAGLRRLLSSEVCHRRVSLATVNSKNFLSSCGDRESAVSVIHTDVTDFLGIVSAERGVVDLVSGDHMFAYFNASRMCTTHKVSAARVIWQTLSRRRGSLESRRTGAACSGSVVCGDFGTSEMRRFMVLGAAFNTLHGLERVASQLEAALVDEIIGSDADVTSFFFSVIVERLCFRKRCQTPFLLWQLTGTRGAAQGDEWMYMLERQERNPHEEWNVAVHGWLHFGRPLTETELQGFPTPFDATPLTRPREQTFLQEAGVAGATVAFRTCCSPSVEELCLQE